MKKSLLLLSVLFVGMVFIPGCKKSPVAETSTAMSITVTSTNSTIFVDQTEQMSATVTMSNGTTKNATGTWSSDNTAVATVTQSGLVTGIAEGVATIACNEGGVSGYKTLAVQIPTITGVTVTSNRSTIYVGQTEQMTATVTMSDGTTKTATGTWSSGNTTVATVNQSGLVTGKQGGKVNIHIDAKSSQPSLSDATILDMRGTKTLTIKKPWSKTGVGDNVFDMPTSVSKVHVIATYTRYSSNFIVYVAGDLFLNELIGTGWGTTTYEGTLLTSGGTVEIKYSSGVSWSFTEVPSSTSTSNSFRKTSVILSPSDPRNTEYNIYKQNSKR